MDNLKPSLLIVGLYTLKSAETPWIHQFVSRMGVGDHLELSAEERAFLCGL